MEDTDTDTQMPGKEWGLHVYMEGRLQPVYTEPHSPGLHWADILHRTQSPQDSRTQPGHLLSTPATA